MYKLAQSMGGKAKAAKIRGAYVANPNLCLQCSAPLLPKLGQNLADVRKKKVCSQKCNAARRKSLGTMPTKRPRMFRACSDCGSNTNSNVPLKRCADCRNKQSALHKLKQRGKGLKAMRRLHLHAKKVLKERPKLCVRCGYDKHAEGAHIQPVSSFPETALLAEVNAPANLVMLCPNCHWEFDHGVFTIPELKL